MSVSLARSKINSGSRGRGWRDVVTQRWCYAFMLPALLLAAMFTFYPMIMSWVYSTLNWSGITDHADFIGLGNYRELIHDQMFWHSFGRSLIFMFVGTPIRLVLALVAAVALNNQLLKLAPVLRTMFFLPVITTAAVVGIVMTFVLGSYQGPVNEVLLALHLVKQPVEFLSDPSTALWSVIGVQIWKNFGMTMIYWLAALQTVPNEYYEAARVDGAGRWQLLKSITVPILMPFAIVIIVLTAKETLHTFALVQAMTQGGPYFATQVIEVYIYQTAFATDQSGGVPRLGYASAAGCFFGLATLVIALVQGWAVKKVSDMRGELQTQGSQA
ncbi:MAG TPA: sugar ABC transporter permease [Microlunatus sp.]